MSGYKLINGNYITILQPTLDKPTDYKTIGRRNVIFLKKNWIKILI